VAPSWIDGRRVVILGGCFVIFLGAFLFGFLAAPALSYPLRDGTNCDPLQARVPYP
jgi:hypothetical protein